MANATRSGKPRNCGLLQTARFYVAADNDVLLTGYGTILLVGAVSQDSDVTGITYDSVDITTGTVNNDAADMLPIVCVSGTSDITALASGAGYIDLYFFQIPTVTAGFTETAYTQV